MEQGIKQVSVIHKGLNSGKQRYGFILLQRTCLIQFLYAAKVKENYGKNEGKLCEPNPSFICNYVEEKA